MGRGQRSAGSAGGQRRSKGERRIASVLASLPPTREQLVAAMDEFGDDFDADVLVAAAAGRARERNKVAALERDFEVLVNWLDELAARGVAEALRRGATESPAGTAFERLHAAGAISGRSAQRLNELRRVRDELQHTYVPNLRAKLLHRAVEALLDELDRFVDHYEKWAKGVGLLS